MRVRGERGKREEGGEEGEGGRRREIKRETEMREGREIARVGNELKRDKGQEGAIQSRRR